MFIERQLKVDSLEFYQKQLDIRINFMLIYCQPKVNGLEALSHDGPAA